VAFEKKVLRDKFKAAGGRWDPLSKVWYVQYGIVRGTELEGRISDNFINGKRRDGHRSPIKGTDKVPI
jgi:hypothetical protein